MKPVVPRLAKIWKHHQRCPTKNVVWHRPPEYFERKTYDLNRFKHSSVLTLRHNIVGNNLHILFHLLKGWIKYFGQDGLCFLFPQLFFYCCCERCAKISCDKPAIHMCYETNVLCGVLSVSIQSHAQDKAKRTWAEASSVFSALGRHLDKAADTTYSVSATRLRGIEVADSQGETSFCRAWEPESLTAFMASFHL